MNSKKNYSLIMVPVFIASILTGFLFGRGEHEISKTFKGIKKVQLNTFSGDCLVKQGSGNETKIHFIHSYSKTDFEPQFIEEEDKLILKEKFHLSGSGDSTWNIVVPSDTVIRFQTLSGNFTVNGLKGVVSANTVSGDIAAHDCKGEFNLVSVSGNLVVDNLSGKINVTTVSSDSEIRELSGDIRIKAVSGDIKAEGLDGIIYLKCPTGDIDINKARGQFDVTTASGDISAEEIIIGKKSKFKVASGDIAIQLGKSVEQDLSLECASGDAVLNYNGNPIEGYFEFKAIADRGQIISPFPFEKEEEEEKWGKKYVIKSFKRELDIPEIHIYTANGKAELKEK